MGICILSATFLLIMSFIHYYTCVLKVPKQQRTLSVMAFYITAIVTLLAILSYSACSTISETNSLTFSFFTLSQAIAEAGIQIIAISQVSSALELGFYLEDMRNDRLTTGLLIANTGRKTTTTVNRKTCINQFFWAHVVVLITLLGSSLTIGAIFIDDDGDSTV